MEQMGSVYLARWHLLLLVRLVCWGSSHGCVVLVQPFVLLSPEAGTSALPFLPAVVLFSV